MISILTPLMVRGRTSEEGGLFTFFSWGDRWVSGCGVSHTPKLILHQDFSYHRSATIYTPEANQNKTHITLVVTLCDARVDLYRHSVSKKN